MAATLLQKKKFRWKEIYLLSSHLRTHFFVILDALAIRRIQHLIVTLNKWPCVWRNIFFSSYSSLYIKSSKQIIVDVWINQPKKKNLSLFFSRVTHKANEKSSLAILAAPDESLTWQIFYNGFSRWRCDCVCESEFFFFFLYENKVNFILAHNEEIIWECRVIQYITVRRASECASVCVYEKMRFTRRCCE